MSATTLPRSDLTGLVLAGGRAQRMGGMDKGLILLRGQPMIAHVIEALRPQVGALLINANRNAEQYAAYGYAVVPDREEGYLGPLAGLAAGLAAARTPWVVTVPCDSPLLAPDLVDRLARALVADHADIAFAHDGVRAHPVFALVRRQLREDLDAYLRSGERKIDHWFERHPHARVDFSDRRDTFINVNTPEERAALEARGAPAPC